MTNGHETEHNDRLHEVRAEIHPFLGGIFEALHDTRVMPERQQWTIPFGSSCGFRAEIVIHVLAYGTCPPVEDAHGQQEQQGRFERFLDMFLEYHGVLPDETENGN